MKQDRHKEWLADSRTQEVLALLKETLLERKEWLKDQFWANPKQAGEYAMLHEVSQAQALESLIEQLEQGDFCED